MLINSIRCFLFFINVCALYSQDYKKKTLAEALHLLMIKKDILEAAVRVYFGFSPMHVNHNVVAYIDIRC